MQHPELAVVLWSAALLAVFAPWPSTSTAASPSANGAPVGSHRARARSPEPAVAVPGRGHPSAAACVSHPWAPAAAELS